MSLNEPEMAILLALEKDPLMPLKKVAEITKISWPTVKKKFTIMQEKDILRNPVATYVPEAIGLLRHNVFVEVQTYQSLLRVEEACREHPYTSYRVRVLHGSFGIYIQFNIPPDTRHHLSAFLDLLVKDGTIQHYKIYQSTGIRKDLYPDLNKFDIKNLQWNFSWREWGETIDQEAGEVRIVPRTMSSEFKKIKPPHLEILRLLTQNAHLKQSEMKEKLGLSKSTLHDYYKFVRNNLVSSIRLNYDRNYFHLTETYILQITDSEGVNDLFNHFINNPPPFRISLDLLEDGSLLLWANMSRVQFNEFSYVIWQRHPTAQFHQLNTHDSGAARYWFYPPNFDFEKFSWRKSRSYMVEEPYHRLGRP